MIRTILILNDEPAMREMIRTILERERYDCIEAGTDQEALRILRSQTVHLIAQDMARGAKGKADGARFTALLKSDPDLRDIPVVIMSAATKEQVATIFEAAGVSFEDSVAGYQRLPFDYKAMLMTIELVLVCRELSVKSRSLARSFGNDRVLSKQLNELERQALALPMLTSAGRKCHHSKMEFFWWASQERIRPLARLVEFLDADPLDELSKRVAQAKRIMLGIERLMGTSERTLLPVTRPVFSAHNVVSLLVDALERQWIEMDVRVESRVSDSLSQVDVADSTATWRFAEALMGIDRVDKILRQHCDPGLIELLLQGHDSHSVCTLFIEATLSKAHQPPKLEISVRSETAVLGKCWFTVVTNAGNSGS